MTGMDEMIKYAVYTQTPAKKSMGRAGVSKAGKPFFYKDPTYEKWEKATSEELAIQMIENGFPTVDYECWAKITIYRRFKRIADLSNLIQSVEDALQRAGCIENDKLIRSLDGSRVYHGVEAGTERFEVTLAPFME